MKKLSLLSLTLAMAFSAAIAAPVDVNLAKTYGQKYVQNTLGKKTAELMWVYTETTDAGADALYVFNYDHGYVVVAADDRAHPILGYSEDAAFDVNRIPEGLQYYLGFYARQIQYAIDNELPADLEIAEQWYLLQKEGTFTKTRMNRAVTPLLSTIWNQDFPYNFYAPACNSYWTGNHCYAGCVACSMSQLMKYWNWPEMGVGEHSYSTSTYGGTLSVNFGEATYNWSIMPNSLGSTADDAAKAVALLMYHCGVAVDMDYSPSGSGASTGDVPPAVIEHFRYGACTNMKYRDEFSMTEWRDMLMSSFDRGIPVIYSGTESDGSGGHAFNCDGYNDQGLFHFNWGWSGQGNNTYYQLDALTTFNGSFNYYQRVVFEMIPDYIYNATVPAIESLTVEVADIMTHTVEISGTIPATSVTGDALQSVQRVILKRNGEVIHTFNNPQPGEEFSFSDEVSEYGCYEYSVCGVNNDMEGEWFSRTVLLGPNCTWKFTCTTTNFQGWNGGSIQVIGANGAVVKEVAMTSSTPLSEKFQMPEGSFSLRWVAPSTEVPTMTISLKNSANQQVYNFSGSSSQLEETIYSGDNDCEGCTPPTNLTGEYQFINGEFGTLLSWSCDYDPSNYKIYRSVDGDEYVEIAKIDNTEHEYFDVVEAGNYYYQVTAFSTVCESTPAITGANTDYVYIIVTSTEENSVKASIYPNPANEKISIQASNISEVVVYNILGQPVYRHQGLTNSLDINTSSIESGIYTVNVISSEGATVRRIMIIH